MTTESFNYIGTDGVPIKAWTKGVQVEEVAEQQLRNIASMPFVHSHVAAMPDVHWGMGATVGSVIPTKGAIIPAAVGVDIGCGMMAVKTSLTSHQLPESLKDLRSQIEMAIPHGRTDNGGENDRGAWAPHVEPDAWFGLEAEYNDIIEKHPKAKARNTYRHMGTLGTGNHFIEVCLDEADGVWIMLHSGSRGVGNRIGTYFIQLAKKEMERFFINLPDADLAYLPEGTEHFNDYMKAVHWAQSFARANREEMMHAVLLIMSEMFRPFTTPEVAVNCHHNYVAQERHFGQKVWLTRKGAVSAREGELGIIPGSMGAKSYIVRGCQWRSKKGPPWRCKKGPLGGCGLVPVVHGRAPRATRRALNRPTRRRAREGPVGPRGQAWAGWSVQLAVGV